MQSLGIFRMLMNQIETETVTTSSANHLITLEYDIRRHRYTIDHSQPGLYELSTSRTRRANNSGTIGFCR